MISPFRRGILFGTIVSIVATAVGVGSVFILIVALATADEAREDFYRHIDELLDTVESTASIACFVGDAQLANEVVSGLLKTHEAARVEVRTADRVLARGNGSSGAELKSQPVTRKIASPFNKDEVVGEISIVPDFDEIGRRVHQKVYFTVLLLSVQLLIIVASVLLIMLNVVVRPIRELSDELHRIDVKAGEKLPVKDKGEGNEIARLVADINFLVETLVNALSSEKQLRLQREIDEQKYHSIFDNAGSGIFISDVNGQLSSFNRSFIELTKFSHELHQKLTDVPWHDAAKLMEAITKCVSSGESLSVEVGIGEQCWLNVMLTSVGGDRVQGVVSDVTQVKRAEATALQRVVQDELTGFANRSGFERYFQQCQGNTLALMLVDIKGFKRINEALGMGAGDLLLKVAAARLKSCLKNSDWIARLGGDEFAVIVHDISAHAAAERIARRVIDAFREPVEINDTFISPGCDIGIAFYPRDGADLKSLLRSAEFALSYSKGEGGEDFRFFDAQMLVKAERSRKTETELRQSIVQDELRLYYQPIVDLESGQIVGAEALIRWQHPEQGLVPPDLFIPLAEASGFICELGLWVLETACRQLAEWQKGGRSLYLSINVSARQIPDALTVGKIVALLKQHGLPPSALALEITEGVMFSDIDQGVNWLKSMRDAGLRVYIDDFGTGYSSLSYLKRFPVDVVKVDRSFIADMAQLENDRLLVQAIIAMSQALGLQVVAEGVESEVQIALLRQMGCRYAQGYHFARPLPAGEFDQLIIGMQAG